jgi:hypothetical protein
MKFIIYSVITGLFTVQDLLRHMFSQSTAGLTGQRDTSYGNYAAYESTKKTHPFIKLIAEFKNPAVAEEKNIVYTTSRQP